MTNYLRTEGVCLRRVDYSETSQVATFLTPSAGRISFMAKGAKRAPKKGIKRGIDLLCRYELVYTERRLGSLHNLTDRHLREGFPGIRTDLRRILHGYYAAELVQNFTVEAQPCPLLYDLLLSTLRQLANGHNPALSVLLLELGVLKEFGTTPTLRRCAICDRPVKAKGNVRFCVENGGVLCKSCVDAEGGGTRSRTIAVRSADLAALAGVSELPPPRPDRVRMSPLQAGAMSRILRFHIQYVLGKPLRMWKYLRNGGTAPQH